MRLESAGSDPGRCCIGMPWILVRRWLQEPSQMRLRRKSQPAQHSWTRSRHPNRTYLEPFREASQSSVRDAVCAIARESLESDCAKKTPEASELQHLV